MNCGDLTTIQDGEVKLVDDRTTHGARAVYSCRENYTLIGDPERVCGDVGVWDGEAPQCLFDWCPEPPTVTGATVTVDGHKAGSLATYTCQNGFILFGQLVCIYIYIYIRVSFSSSNKENFYRLKKIIGFTYLFVSLA